ncbi:MAG: hypothetical protein QXF28_01770 [Nitrososphaerota archaeon]
MFKRFISRLIDSLRRVFRYSRSGELSRRYFAINAFEGALTMWGIILGIYVLGNRDVSQIVSGGIGAVLAMAISGVGSVYIAESAEQERRIREIEEALLTRIDETEILRAHKRAVIMSAIVNSASSSLSGLIILSPYIAAASGVIDGGLAFMTSMVILFSTLFIMGGFLGRISKRNVISAGLKTVTVGGVIMLLLYIMNLLS